ncbi:Nn.00g054190.m01.CDS01 [Neocucurbitaria sp. VM-36]
MRPLQLLLPLLAWVSFGLAQDTGLSSALQHIPKCALPCLSTAIAESSCALTNSTCICMNTKLQDDAQACILQSCTLKQALTTKNLTATACHAPVVYKGESARVSNIILAVVTVFIALSRVIYKAIFSVGELGWDDWTVLSTLITGVPSVIIIDRGLIPNGLGRDIWTLPFDHITNFVRWLYALEVLYFLQIAQLKLTLLFFFLRIFPKPLIRRLLWATVVFNVLYGAAFVITAIFQCQPISHYWMAWHGESAGKCININGLAWSNAIISIILDIWMLVLPLYEIFHLQLSWRKKISVAMMFCVGTFVTVVSILRLRSLVHFAVSTNSTMEQTDVISWSNIEVNVGIICACMPALRVMLVRCFPKVFGTTKGTSQAYQVYGSRSQGVKKGGSALASGMGRSATASARDPNTITYTKTFEVQHADNDETLLVQMDEFGPKKPKMQSSSTSISSL